MQYKAVQDAADLYTTYGVRRRYVWVHSIAGESDQRKQILGVIACPNRRPPARNTERSGVPKPRGSAANKRAERLCQTDHLNPHNRHTLIFPSYPKVFPGYVLPKHFRGRQYSSRPESVLKTGVYCA